MKGTLIMKKILAFVLSVVLVFGCCTMLAGAKGNKVTLYVYNWGQYIAEGDDDSMDIIAAFEDAYPNIKVKYSTFDSNESMYSKLVNGGLTVDGGPDGAGGYAAGAELRQHPQCPVY